VNRGDQPSVALGFIEVRIVHHPAANGGHERLRVRPVIRRLKQVRAEVSEESSDVFGRVPNTFSFSTNERRECHERTRFDLGRIRIIRGGKRRD
jgi:hypothetical protein